jgi:hypothetical protein
MRNAARLLTRIKNITHIIKMANTFFDVHCHLFNLIDVPLWETFSGAMRMHTLVGLATIFAGQQILKKQRYFLRFFERSSETNLLWFSEQICTALQSDPELYKFYGSPSAIVITPLIMDFDTHIQNMPCMPGDECVERQYQRLQEAISKCKPTLSTLPLPVRVFPFMGLALDKFNHHDPNHRLERFKDWWSMNGMSPEERRRPWDKMPQKAIGIKLYPALGFQPYPSTQHKDKYLEFYHWCVQHDIPLTVHCQPGAYDPDNLNNDDPNSSPAFWRKVLETEGLQTLRMNFAHFGGGGSIPSLFDEYGHPNSHNETNIIIDMLRTYPHTYADLSAINFCDQTINQGFARLLSNDLQEEHDRPYSLCEKLIWGSDVPMVIGSPQYHHSQARNSPEMGYIHCLDYFKSSIEDVRSIVHGQPNSFSQAKQMQVMQGLTCTNPEHFLHSHP